MSTSPPSSTSPDPLDSLKNPPSSAPTRQAQPTSQRQVFPAPRSARVPRGGRGAVRSPTSIPQHWLPEENVRWLLDVLCLASRNIWERRSWGQIGNANSRHMEARGGLTFWLNRRPAVVKIRGGGEERGQQDKISNRKRGRDSVPFQRKRGEGDGGVFGRIMEEVEELTLPGAGGGARRFDTLCGNVLRRVNEGEEETKTWSRKSSLKIYRRNTVPPLAPSSSTRPSLSPPAPSILPAPTLHQVKSSAS